MLDAEVGTKAEASASTICVVGYMSLLPIGLDVLDGFDVRGALNLRSDREVLDGLEVLVSRYVF